MIILLHHDAEKFIKATKDNKKLSLNSNSLSGAFWELANSYPEELIIWRDQNVDLKISNAIANCFSHQLIMASYAVESQFIPDQIGYIDQLPFVNPNYNVVYPTWRISTDVGGIYGKIALKFQELFKDIKNFGFLINSIAKTGQQNSLFCYSNPGLVEKRQIKKLKFKGGDRELFSFVGQYYKKEWLWVLFFCMWKYEKRLPVVSMLRGFKKKSYFKKRVHLPIEDIQRKNNFDFSNRIDVIVPTLFRAGHVQNLLNDLSEQSHFPIKVIIVEQDPDPNSKSQLDFLNRQWPFPIVHHFVHKTGACYARNLAMQSVRSEYIFFADDDIELEWDLLERSLREIKRLDVGCLNLNCLQPGQKTVFHKIKQWGAFGSGTSIVKSEYALQCRFSEFLEKGFGEDIDFGLQLRAKGCDIIYHPELSFIHLKAARGGFREVMQKQDQEKEKPKPSPTMMYLVKSSYNSIMQKGYKASLFLKYYRNQKIKNPIRYFGVMQRRWKLSEKLYEELQKSKA